MEVASPFTSLRPSPGGGVLLSSSSSNNSNKRAACSSPSQLLLCPMEDGMITADHHHHHHHMAAAHASKRRRFHAPSEIDSLSAEFSSHTLFFNNKNNAPSSQQKSIFATNGASSIMKRVRMATTTESCTSSPTPDQQHQQQEQAQKKHEELERVIQEQASLIESLQADKVGIEKSFASLKSDHERITKDNGILRKAVTIQEERRVHLEQEVKATKVQSDERIRSLEQVILTLRYHLQTSQSNVVANDFMHQRPPDVY